MMRPVGRGTLLGMFRAGLVLPNEREVDDVFGIELCAVMTGRLKLPCGGCGTVRDIGEDMAEAPPVMCDGSDDTRPRLCGGRGTLWLDAMSVGSERIGALELPSVAGGRGTKRPAGCGNERAVVNPSEGRPADGFSVLPAVPICVLWAGTIALGLAEFAGGVILLTVGRTAVPADGCAADNPALGPSTLARVGDRSGLLMLAMLCKAEGEILAAFAATGNECCSVLLETAVKAPGRLA